LLRSSKIFRIHLEDSGKSCPSPQIRIGSETKSQSESLLEFFIRQQGHQTDGKGF